MSTQLYPNSLWSRILRRGFVGSVLLLISALIINNLPNDGLAVVATPFQWFGSTVSGRWVGALVGACGVALLAHSWVKLTLMPETLPVKVRLARTVTAVKWWCLPLLLAPPMYSNDGWSYVAQGALAQAGLSPYDNAPGDMPGHLTDMVDPIWRFTPTPYGPVPITWGALCAELTHDPFTLLLLQRVPVVIGLVLTLWAVPKLARAAHVDAGRATALAAASPFVLTHGVGGMHNDAFIMGMAAAALALALRKSWFWACVVVGIASACKVTAIVAVVPVILLALPVKVEWWKRFLALAGGGLVAGATVALCGLPYGLGFGWLQGMNVPGMSFTLASVPSALGAGVEGLMDLFGIPGADDAVPWARAVGMGVAVASVVVLALLRPTGQVRPAMVTMLACFFLVIFLAPVVHSWYGLTLVPFAAVLLTSGIRLRLALLAGGFLAFITPFDRSLAGAGILIVGLAVAVLVISWWFLIHVRREVPSDEEMLEAERLSQTH